MNARTHDHDGDAPGADVALLVRWRDDVEPLGDDALATVRARVMEQVDADDAAPVVPIRRRRRPLVAVAAAIAAAVLVVPAAAGQLWPSDEASLSAAELLNQAADELIESSDVAIGPGQWLHVKLEEGPPDASEPSAVAFGTMQRTERWVPYDQSGDWYMLRADHGSPQPAVVAAQGQFYEEPSPLGTWDNPTAAFYASVPRDVPALRAEFPARQRLAFHRITDVLKQGLMPADLRAAVYRVLATLPDVQVLDDGAANLAGQEGIAFSLREVGAEAYYDQIIIDPDTGRFIGTRSVWEDDGVVSWIGAMSYEVVDEVPAQVRDEARRVAWQPCQKASCMPEGWEPPASFVAPPGFFD
jgi:hypothetical protein